MRALRKDQARVFALQDGIVGEARIVERAFGIGSSALTEAMALLQDRLATAEVYVELILIHGLPRPSDRFATGLSDSDVMSGLSMFRHSIRFRRLRRGSYSMSHEDGYSCFIILSFNQRYRILDQFSGPSLICFLERPLPSQRKEATGPSVDRR